MRSMERNESTSDASVFFGSCFGVGVFLATGALGSSKDDQFCESPMLMAVNGAPKMECDFISVLVPVFS